MDQDIQIFQQRDGSDIFVPAELIGNPLSLFPAVIEIQHRRDGIHAQAIDMVPVQPKERAIQQEVPNLDSIVIEDAAMPIRMVPEPRVGMVVEMCAVKLGEPMRIVRKMRRGPVHQHPDSSLMRRIDKGHEVFGGSVPSGDGEIPGRLIAPGSVERVLSNRQQFQMGIAHILHIGDKLFCKL